MFPHLEMRIPRSWPRVHQDLAIQVVPRNAPGAIELIRHDHRNEAQPEQPKGLPQPGQAETRLKRELQAQHRITTRQSVAVMTAALPSVPRTAIDPFSY